MVWSATALDNRQPGGSQAQKDTILVKNQQFDHLRNSVVMNGMTHSREWRI